MTSMQFQQYEIKRSQHEMKLKTIKDYIENTEDEDYDYDDLCDNSFIEDMFNDYCGGLYSGYDDYVMVDYIYQHITFCQ